MFPKGYGFDPDDVKPLSCTYKVPAPGDSFIECSVPATSYVEYGRKSVHLCPAHGDLVREAFNTMPVDDEVQQVRRDPEVMRVERRR
jgi:hypothetical protein